MNPNFGMSVADALSKSHEISKKDAERFPEEKAKILTSKNICALSWYYQHFDPDKCLNFLLSVENNRRRLKEEMTFFCTIWFMDSYNVINPNKKVHLGDRVRLATLAEKYDLDTKYQEIPAVLFAFPDILCKLLLKNPHNFVNSSNYFTEYKHFKDEHKWPFYIGMLPTGKKYGGFVKVIVHLCLVGYKEERILSLIISENCCLHLALATLRASYNATLISQERRVDFFENLDIKETDCDVWSKHFDRQFPEYSYIHMLFGQVA